MSRVIFSLGKTGIDTWMLRFIETNSIYPQIRGVRICKKEVCKGEPMGTTPTREEAWKLLTDYVPSDNLQRHALAVEAVMRYMARKRGEDEEQWGLIGLVHDIDYERHPEEHCKKAPEILRQHGWPEEVIRAVVSHGWGICSDVEPLSTLEKTLYTIDELTGLVAAAALVRPSKSILDLPVKSVLKKWKDKAFAAGADRSVIERGAAMLGVELADLIADCIEGMKTQAEVIGLKGNL
jgi:putative nucleotidyltransferase with HDIG domain